MVWTAPAVPCWPNPWSETWAPWPHREPSTVVSPREVRKIIDSKKYLFWRGYLLVSRRVVRGSGENKHPYFLQSRGDDCKWSTDDDDDDDDDDDFSTMRACNWAGGCVKNIHHHSWLNLCFWMKETLFFPAHWQIAVEDSVGYPRKSVFLVCTSETLDFSYACLMRFVFPSPTKT